MGNQQTPQDFLASLRSIGAPSSSLRYGAQPINNFGSNFMSNSNPTITGMPNTDFSNILGQQPAVPGSQFSVPDLPGVGAPAAAGGGGLFSSFLQNPDGSGGWGSAALDTFSGLSNAWLGMQQYGLAKDALKHSKKQFSSNFNAQATTHNADIEARQNARILSAGSGSGQYQSTADYMDKNRINKVG